MIIHGAPFKQYGPTEGAEIVFEQDEFSETCTCIISKISTICILMESFSASIKSIYIYMNGIAVAMWHRSSLHGLSNHSYMLDNI